MMRCRWFENVMPLLVRSRARIRASRKSNPSRHRCGTHRCRLVAESLEPRLLLDNSGILWGNAPHLTLSFAPDDTLIGEEPNALFATLGSIAAEASWQSAILQAFQNWAVHTNIDIGVVPDGGQPFGSPGPTQQAPRFGDIRIGALPMSPEVLAVSVPHNQLVSGTWVGDVLLNSEGTFHGLDDLFSVALHEAGHVLGLEHSEDPLSPMFVHGVSGAVEPTADDIAALRQLYGVRVADANEGRTGNGSFTDATRIKYSSDLDEFDGSNPLIAFGDITDHFDSDYFFLPPLEEYTGAVTLQVRSSGLSLLSPELSVFNESHQLVELTTSTNPAGDVVTIQIDPVVRGETLFLKVESAVPDEFGIGSYAIVATFDDNLQVDDATIDLLASGAFRFLEQGEIQDLLEQGESLLLRDDMHLDDSFAMATTLNTTAGFDEFTRFDVVGSIADATDVDFYKFKSADVASGQPSVVTVILRSLDSGGLIPEVTVLDRNENVLPFQIVVNGNGDYIVQVSNVEPSKNHVVKVNAADSAGRFNTGNYKLAVVFGQQEATFDTFASGLIDVETPRNSHSLHVSQTQLFHFALEVGPVETDSPVALVASFFDTDDSLVYQLAARPGETRTDTAVLLPPGTYSVRVIAVSLGNSPPPQIAYSILGGSVSEPVGPPPDDPTGDPVFECPDNPDLFCYPGGILSSDPFLWGDFLGSLPEIPDVDPSTLISLLVADWWSWFWNLDPESNAPPLALNDSFATPTGVALRVDATAGILGNDVDPEGTLLASVLASDVSGGTLSLALDGSLVYQPNDGFSGIDQFTYFASDYVQESNVATATITVAPLGGSIPADTDANGQVDLRDLMIVLANLGQIGAVGPHEGDINGDTLVNRIDAALLIRNLGRTSSLLAPAAAQSPTVSPLLSTEDVLVPQRPLSDPSGNHRHNSSTTTRRHRQWHRQEHQSDDSAVLKRQSRHVVSARRARSRNRLATDVIFGTWQEP